MRTGLKNTIRLAGCAALLTGVLVLSASPAFSQEPYGTVGTTPPNGNVAAQVLGETVSRPATPANAVAASRLALTGADIAGLSVIAVTFIVLGAVLVLRSRRPILS